PIGPRAASSRCHRTFRTSTSIRSARKPRTARMFRQIVAFELRYQARQPLLWGMAAIFFVLSFIATVTDALSIGGAIGSLNRNAPYVVVRMLGALSLVGVFTVVAFVATAVLRDFERGTDELVFSRPIRTRDLLWGRFVGSVAAVCACFTF